MKNIPSNPDFSGMPVLVTGAGGFIGSHLAEYLASNGAKVRAMVRYSSSGGAGWLEPSPFRSEIDIIHGDVRDSLSVERAMDGCRIVFHLAALIGIPYSYSAPDSYVDTNVQGTLNILNAARRHNVRVVHTSTSEVYGSALYTPIDEKHPLQGQSPYSATKIGADMLVESYFRSFESDVVTVRPFNTYGPRQSARAIIPTVISQCLAGKSEIMLGDLTPTRDLNFVSNTVYGFALASLSQKVTGEVINFGTGKEISISQLASEIIRLTGSNAEVLQDPNRLRPKKSEVNRLLCENSKARTLLDWEPIVSLDEGLEETISWISANMDSFNVESYMV